MKAFSNSKISLSVNGRTYSLSCGDPRFKTGYKLLVEGKDKEFISLLSESAEKAVVKDKAGFRIDGDTIYYKNFEIAGCLKTKIQSLIREGLDLTPFVNFCEKVNKNPSRETVLELFEFLNVKEFPITLDGNVIGYKAVREDYYSFHGNTKTLVTKGIVDKEGRILNTVGAEIEVPRNEVDDNRDNECSNGLHLSSLEYSHWFGQQKGGNYKIIVVEFDPADAVSVPKDFSFSKLRCSKYRVIADYVSEITASVVKIDSGITEIKAPVSVKDKVKRYIQNKIKAGVDNVSVRNIAKSVEAPQALVHQIVSEEGYYVNQGKFDI